MIGKTQSIMIGAAALGLLVGIGVGKRQRDDAAPASTSADAAEVAPKRSLEKALAAAFEMVDGARRDALMGLAEAMSDSEIETALSQLEFPHDFEIAQKLLVEMAGSDPERALALAESLPIGEKVWIKDSPASATGQSSVWLKFSVLREWATHDPEAALARAVEVEASMSKWTRDQWLLHGVVKAAADGSAVKAAEYRERGDRRLFRIGPS